MLDREKQPTGLMHTGEQLRKLLLEYPKLPVIVFARDTGIDGNYDEMCCTNVSAEVGEFLDCQQEIRDECFTSRDHFRDEVYDFVDFNSDLEEDELEDAVEEAIEEYEPYWKPCIILTVGN